MLIGLQRSYLVVLLSVAVAAVGVTSFIDKINVSFLDLSHSFSVQFCFDFYDENNYSPEPNFLVELETSTINFISLLDPVAISHNSSSVHAFVCRKLPSIYVELFSWFGDLLINRLKVGYISLSILFLCIIKNVSLRVLKSVSRFNCLFNFSYLKFSYLHSKN